MRSVTLILSLVLAGLEGGCSGAGPAAATSTANVVVVGAQAAPAPLTGFVIDSGTADGSAAVALTCSEDICYETLQLQNTGLGCAANIDGDIDVFSVPASTTSLMARSTSAVRVPNNPTLLPGQITSVNVAVPAPPAAVSYIDVAVLNWTNPSCP
jgi:hypothetical protein